ncbi:MAG: Cu-processing system permease protein [Myxococcota bacterium]|jgi:Cu-processing system permease protein
MGRVGAALVLNELQERGRDRWVVVVTGLFAILAVGIAAYGSAAGDSAAVVTAPSLVTLATFLVPLVALVLGHDAIVGERERHTLGLLLSLPVRRGEVLLAKYIGRLLALVLAVSLGLGSACIFLDAGQRTVVLSLLPPTLLLGAAFLSIGVLISTSTRRVATAASLAVAIWFLLVFMYDLGLLAVLVATDGALSQDVVAWAVMLNPAGLYRTALIAALVGDSALTDLGMAVTLPGIPARTAIWLGWILVPLGIGVLQLGRRRAVTA